MKALFLATLTVLVFGATAKAKPLTVDGLQSHYSTQLTDEVSHTEYRQEEQQTTCSRQVQVGSHQECQMVGGGQDCQTVGGGQECHTVGGGQECHEVGGGQQCQTVGGGQECGLTPSGYQCHDVPGHQECYLVPGHQECYQTPGHEECYQTPGHEVCTDLPGHQECNEVPDYKTEYYSCTQTINVPYTVKDYDIVNDVSVEVAMDQKLPAQLHEVLDFTQAQDELQLKSINTTGKVLIYATKKQTEISNNGQLKKIKSIVNLKLVDRNLALGAFLTPASDLSADSNTLKITTGSLQDASLVRFDLTINRRKLFGKDEQVFQRTLQSNEVTLTPTGQQTVISIDFKKLGIQDKISGKKVHIELQMQSNMTTNQVLNGQDIPGNLLIKKALDTKL